MASPLVWKIYDAEGDLVASTKYAEDAASVVANITSGVVKRDGRIVWREGREEIGASESYDQAAYTMHNRIRTYYDDRLARFRAHAHAIATGESNGSPH